MFKLAIFDTVIWYIAFFAVLATQIFLWFAGIIIAFVTLIISIAIINLQNFIYIVFLLLTFLFF